MKKIIINLVAFAFILGIFFVPAYSTLAACGEAGQPPCKGTVNNNPGSGVVNNPGGQTQTINPIISNPFKGGNSITDLFMAILRGIVLPIGGVLAVLAFIYAGFKFVMARGNTTQIQEAKRALLYAVVGTILLLGAEAIAGAIKSTVDQLR